MRGEAMTLLPWPIEHGGYPTTQDTLDYERARAEAALQRLRVARHALDRIEGFIHSDGWDSITKWNEAYIAAQEALAMIGEVPPA
jgi:hypothetical protein